MSLLSCQIQWVLIPLCQPLFKHALDLPMGSLDTQSPLLYHWHCLANSVAWEQAEIHGMNAFCWLRNQSLKAEIPILLCSIRREARQKEPLWVSLALCQPCFEAAPLWWVLSSVQSRHSPALHRALWSCWECVHPNPNSSGMDTLLVYRTLPQTGPCYDPIPIITGWSER